VKHEAAHYWAGTKALLLNVKLTYRILREKFAGRRALKRSERKLVKRTLGTFAMRNAWCGGGGALTGARAQGTSCACSTWCRSW
jgi:hypothetical protein